MSRGLYLLNSDEMRRKLAGWMMRLPNNTRVELREPKRSLPQNDRLWLLLTAVAAQGRWQGEKLTDIEWKDMFTGAYKIAAGGNRIRAVPGLEGGIMLLGLHSSEMSKTEMVELQDYIEAWAAQNGVVIPEQVSPDALPREAAA